MRDTGRSRTDDQHDQALADDDDTAGHLMVRTDETVTPDKDRQDASRRS